MKNRTSQHLVTDLRGLATAAFALVEPHGRSVASSNKTWHAATLFIIVARYLDAAACYATAFEKAQHIPTEPFTTLVRALMEACDGLHYAYLDKVSDAELELRRVVGDIHHDREDAEFRRLLRLPRGDFMSNIGLRSRYLAEQLLPDNPVFGALSEGQQRDIRAGRRARSNLLPRVELPFGWTSDETTAVYKFLSNFAHSTSWSHYGAELRATDRLGTKSALLIANHIGAWTLARYCRRRTRLAARLTGAQRVHVRAVNERDGLRELIQIWGEPSPMSLGDDQ
jgi:hypothetical protein